MPYLCTKLEDFSFTHSRRYDWAPQLKRGHMTPTMPLSGMICHPRP